jgi:amino acid transporter
MSKETYLVNEVPAYDGHAPETYVEPVSGVESKSSALNKAGEIYGNIQTAEGYGYVTRGHVSEPVPELETVADTFAGSNHGISNLLPLVARLVLAYSWVSDLLSLALVPCPCSWGTPSQALPSSL